MSASPQPEQPVRSTFADDPEMHELIEFFVEEIPNRVRAMSTAWEKNDLESLKRLAHQLKGSSGGYGFEVISKAAAVLELQLKDDDRALDALAEDYQQLIDLCNRVMF